MGPVDDVRVVEITSLAPAPSGCMILSDLGTDVLRVERPEACQQDAPVPVDPLTPGRRSIGLNLLNNCRDAHLVDPVTTPSS